MFPLLRRASSTQREGHTHLPAMLVSPSQSALCGIVRGARGAAKYLAAALRRKILTGIPPHAHRRASPLSRCCTRVYALAFNRHRAPRTRLPAREFRVRPRLAHPPNRNTTLHRSIGSSPWLARTRLRSRSFVHTPDDLLAPRLLRLHDTLCLLPPLSGIQRLHVPTGAPTFGQGRK